MILYAAGFWTVYAQIWRTMKRNVQVQVSLSRVVLPPRTLQSQEMQINASKGPIFRIVAEQSLRKGSLGTIGMRASHLRILMKLKIEQVCRLDLGCVYE